MPQLHHDELSIDTALVRRLVARDFPAWAGERLQPLASSGSSNRLFRLGDDKVVRLPRQPGGGASIDKEARWLPVVAARVDVAVPTVLGLGGPDEAYSERWAVTTWLPGVRPAVAPAASRRGTGTLARGLVRFLTDLRGTDVPEQARAEESLAWYRGQPLWTFDADVRELASRCRDHRVDLDLDQVLRVWDRCAEASRDVVASSTWYHGDLAAENLLADASGGLGAVLDFGGLGVGDPTVDLVVAWEVLDDDGRRLLRRALDVEDAAWEASRGWVLFIALMTFDYYGTTMPSRCADRLAVARAALA